MDLKLETINLKDIKEYENNAKKHPDTQIKQIKESIEQLGYNDPIALDEKNEVIEGQGRLEALKQLKKEKIQILRLNNLSESQKKAYRIAHNKLSLNTDFDLEKLKGELKDLKEYNFDLDLTGFSDVEISEVDDQFNETEEDNFDTDKSAKEPKYKIQKGEIWGLGAYIEINGKKYDVEIK